MKDTAYFRQAELLLRILPLIYRKKMFALKGGTAINFFVRDLPRLSVDIDLAYLPVKERELALNDIGKSLVLISQEIERAVTGTKITLKRIHGTDFIRGMVVNQEGVTVKIEPNLVLRGSVYPVETKRLCKKAQDLFELSVISRTLSMEELYAGKICAALDRQHPRDLFDVYLLIKNEGLTDKIRRAFIVYLISHPRPMIEILSPKPNEMRDIFEKEFRDLIAEDVTYESLEATREQMISLLSKGLTTQERKFIVSVKKGVPDWDLLGLEGVENLPAVKWKLVNIGKMAPSKHKKALHRLRDYLMI